MSMETLEHRRLLYAAGLEIPAAAAEPLRLTGTLGDDLVELVAQPTPGAWTVELNGVEQGAGPGVADLHFDALGGNDTIRIVAGDGDDTLEMRPGSAVLTAEGYSLTLSGAEQIFVDGRGGNDKATLYDGAGDDQFWAWPGGGLLLAGATLSNQVEGFESVRAESAGAGHDVAKLYDSPGDDLLVTTPSYATLIGPDFVCEANRFDVVHAYATAGGLDIAKLFDSSGDDIYHASPIEAGLSAAGSYCRAKFFEAVHAYATGGGHDTARFVDSPGDDTLVASSNEAALYRTGSGGFYVRAKHFEAVTAEAIAGGHDEAILRDSPGDDLYVATPTYGRLLGDGFDVDAQHFETVRAQASAGGLDVAKLYDSPGDDLLVTTPGRAALSGPGFQREASGFDAVHAYATGGGSDAAELYGAGADDRVVVEEHAYAVLSEGSYHRAKFFETNYVLVGVPPSTLDEHVAHARSADGAPQSAVLSTDQSDYLPGSTAVVTADGYEVGETVLFQVMHSDGTSNLGEGHQAWQVTDGGPGDLDLRADGSIQTRWYVSPDDSDGSSFLATAKGLLSGRVATTTFTDGGGDFSLDFVASAPLTYSPYTGGGAYNDRTVGRADDVVESLEGSDFTTGDVVTFLTHVTVSGDGSDDPQTIEIDFSFAANSSGQPGVGYIDVTNVQINYGPVENGDGGAPPGGGQGVFGLDSGINDDRQTAAGGDTGVGGSTATLVSEEFDPAGSTPFGTPPNDADELLATVQIDDLVAGEEIVLRVDVFLGCDVGSTPTGTLQARMTGARVVRINGDTVVDDAISGGQQTVPLNQVGDLLGAGEPVLDLLKTVTDDLSGADTVGVEQLTVASGTTVRYLYTVSNPGTHDLLDLVIVDDAGTSGVPGDDFVVDLTNILSGSLADLDAEGTPNDLPAGGSVVLFADVALSASGTIVNTGLGTGNNGRSGGQYEEFTNSDTATVIVEGEPEILLEKIGTFNDEDGDGLADAGETISYTFTVTNTGNVTLTGVTVSDPKVTVIGGPTTLDPDEIDSTTFSGTYTVTQTDIDSGQVDNTATAESNESDPASDEETVFFDQTASIWLDKYLISNTDVDGSGGFSAGDLLTYGFAVRNTGPVTLTQVFVSDPLPGLSSITGGATTLTPGETTTFTATYVVSAADDAAGSVRNTATAFGNPPWGDPGDPGDDVTDTDTMIVGQPQTIVVSTDKGGDSQPWVMMLDRLTGEVVAKFLAYEEDYQGGVRIATGDLTGDGVDEIVTAPGRSHAPMVKVFTRDGIDPETGLIHYELLQEFLAYGSDVIGGVEIAVGNVVGGPDSPWPDVVTVPTFGPSEVRVFRNVSTPANPTSEPIKGTPDRSFLAFPADFIGGAVVDAADMGIFADGVTVSAEGQDGVDEIIVGNGPSMRSTVKVFDLSGATPAVVKTFLPFADDFRGGVSLDAVRVNDDAIADLILGAGNRGNSAVEVWDGRLGTLMAAFAAWDMDAASRNAPVRVAGLDTDSDGIADWILTAQGTDGKTRTIRSFELGLDPLVGGSVDRVLEDPDFLLGAYFLDVLV